MRILAVLATIVFLFFSSAQIPERPEIETFILIFVSGLFLLAFLRGVDLRGDRIAKYSYADKGKVGKYFTVLSTSFTHFSEVNFSNTVNSTKRDWLTPSVINVKNVATLILLFSSLNSIAQSNATNLSKREFDFTATLGQKQGSFAFAYNQLFPVVKNSKWYVGYGVRLTNYLGDKRDFITAGPAKYTRSFTTPFLIFFAGQREENFDTLVVQMPIAFSLNASINAAYQFNSKLSAGFNIDVVGFTIARKTSAVFKSNGLTRTDPSVKPTNFNLLLTGDHDLGTLNSEFYLKYNWNKRWSYKLVYQFLFVEYQSNLYKQQLSDGVETNRFRNKVNAFGIGVTYNLKSK